MLFSEDEVKLIFKTLIDLFPDAEMIVTIVHKFLIGKNITSGVTFKWGLEKTEEILGIDPRIKLMECWRTSDLFKNRQSFALHLLSTISNRGKYLNRILKLSFKNLMTERK